MQPLVRAAVPTVPGLEPGLGTTFQPGTTAASSPARPPRSSRACCRAPVPGTGAASQAAARSTELLRTGVWLIVSLAGTAFGIALSASLISMLR